MEELISSIEKSLEFENWNATLAVALIISDICGKIDEPKEKSSKVRYVKWFDQYIKRSFWLQESCGSAMMSGGDCYAIRCAFLHEFSDNLEGHKARRILSSYKFYKKMNFRRFSERPNGFLLEMGVGEFCNIMCIGVVGASVSPGANLP